MKLPFKTSADYAFLLKEIMKVPKFLNFFITSDCTCRCVMCNFWRKPPSYVGTERFKQTIEAFANVGFNTFSLTGGEPLLHPKYFDFIRYIKQRGFYANSPTNGTLLTEHSVRKLQASRVDSIGLSIDSLNPKIADNNRRHPGQLKKALAGLRLLSQYEIPHYVIVILAKHNINDFLTMIRIFDEEYDSPTMLCFPDEGVGPLSDIIFTHEQLIDLLDELLLLKKHGLRLLNASKYLEDLKHAYLNEAREIPCFGGYYVLNAYPDGSVKPCFNRKAFGTVDALPELRKRRCSMCLNQCFIEQSYISEIIARKQLLTVLRTQMSVFKMQLGL